MSSAFDAYYPWLTDVLDRFMATVLDIAIDQDHVARIASLISRLKAFEQRKYFNSVIVYITKKFFHSGMISKDGTSIVPSPLVSGAARLLSAFMLDNEILKDHIVSALPRSAIPSLTESLATHRAVISALSQDEGP